MINLISSWAEQIIIAIVVTSIIEMILPESKNKKYIKMVIGIYILFTIISPVVNKNNLFDLQDLSLESFASTDKNIDVTKSKVVNQKSMDERLQELYIQELENNIKNKAKQEGFNVISCEVDAVLYGDEENQEIKKINLIISNENTNSDIKETNKKSDIQSIEKVEINVGLDKILGNSNYIESDEENNEASNSTKKLKEILSTYYEIDSKKIHILAK